MGKQQIEFVKPSAHAFVQALLPQSVTQPVLLVGDSELACEINTLASSSGVDIDSVTDLSGLAGLTKGLVIVFTEQDGEKLGDLLLGCLELKDVSIIAPITNRHFSRMPLFIVSIPKAGTHLVYELVQALGYAPGVELPDSPRPKTWYCVEYSNSHTVARDFFVDTVRRAPFGNRYHPAVKSPVIFAYRHPLDILVSEAHYYHRDGKTSFSGYFDKLEFEERVELLMNDEWLLGSLRQRVGGFLPWLKLPNVIPASFEELIGDAGGGSIAAQHDLIWSILLKLQVDGSVSDLADKVFNKNSDTFREGKIGAWRAQLTSKLISQLKENCGDVISAYGYSANVKSSLMPDNLSQHLNRPLRYSKAEWDDIPFAVARNFMGCNLVRYAGKFYAVPFSAGPFDLTKMTIEQESNLLVAKSLDELRAVMLIGRAAYDKKEYELLAAGEKLRTNCNVFRRVKLFLKKIIRKKL